MKIIKITFSLFVFVLLNGCSSGDEDSVNVETAELRVIHASPDAPTVNVLANGEVLGFLVGVNYQQGSEKFTLESGTSYDFAIQAKQLQAQ